MPPSRPGLLSSQWFQAELRDVGGIRISDARSPYRLILRRKTGVERECEGGGSAKISEKVSLLVEKSGKGLGVMVKEQPKTEELIAFTVLEGSMKKAPYANTDKHLSPKEEVGSNRGLALQLPAGRDGLNSRGPSSARLGPVLLRTAHRSLGLGC